MECIHCMLRNIYHETLFLREQWSSKVLYQETRGPSVTTKGTHMVSMCRHAKLMCLQETHRS